MSETRLTLADLEKPMKLATGEKHRIVIVGWLGLELVDEAGSPVPDVAYQVKQGNQRPWTGTLDEQGKAKVRGVLPGPCDISFPGIDAVEWLPEAQSPKSVQTYVVKPDEHVAAIAARFGFRSFTTIWQHPKNAALRKLREDPHVLEPGDRLCIPNHSKSVATRQSGAWYQFKLKAEPIKLRLKLLSLMGEPIAGAACTLVVDGKSEKLTSDEGGLVEMVIPYAAQKATLTTENAEYELSVGGLDPIDTPSGLHARLRNLGYEAGTADEENAVDSDDPGFAIELFQFDHGLPVTGTVDDETKSAIQQAAGA
jgi:hypothetical protein